MSVTPTLIPRTTDAITMTTITPIAIPRIVSAARALLARTELSAIATPSMSDVTFHSCRIATTGSSREARPAG